MSTELERALRNAATDLTLDTPAADVLARGDRLRRSRRRGLALGASGVVAAAATVTAVVGGQSRDREPADAVDPVDTGRPSTIQVAAWTGPDTNLSGDQLADVGATCAASDGGPGGLTEPGWRLPGSIPPRAAELRDDVVLAYYGQRRDYATCVLQTTAAGGLQVVARSAGVEKALPAGRHVELVTSGAGDPGPLGGNLARIYAVVRTSPDVTRLELTAAGRTYSSTADGLGFFWLPDGELTEADLAGATVTALDADGAVLHRSGPGELW
ncbi:hypothetical protein [Nocardioides sp. 1609]|uniref:hypothetical protein n=1 Tax=Nocardioides sp. 1609 TaxID=2508327 RepID=UPI00106F63FC|nr:hypothetical protein [Nocardioides sp. 1609]